VSAPHRSTAALGNRWATSMLSRRCNTNPEASVSTGIRPSRSLSWPRAYSSSVKATPLQGHTGRQGRQNAARLPGSLYTHLAALSITPAPKARGSQAICARQRFTLFHNRMLSAWTAAGNRDQGQVDIANALEQALKRGLVGPWAGKQRLIPFQVRWRQACKPIRPACIQMTLGLDLAYPGKAALLINVCT
jgi:hypothetical protein